PGRCGRCGNAFHRFIFPALLAPPPSASAGEAIMAEAESSCFYHPAKRAEAMCDYCGRFVCGLCDIPLSGGHYCPTCVEQGHTTPMAGARIEPRLSNEPDVIHHDMIALDLSFWPIVTFFLTLFTAPIALFLALRHWRTPQSIMKRRRWRAVLAICLSVAQIGFWILFFAAMLGL
ncbi:MAG: hypothetical protein WD873_05480, partial [Candidatus Hydrogenedentales bacterium]